MHVLVTIEIEFIDDNDLPLPSEVELDIVNAIDALTNKRYHAKVTDVEF